MDDMMIFAERLTAEIERQKLTYRQLAEKMGITVTTLFRYAKGQRVPKATEIVKASKALGVTCDYLIGLSDDPHKTSRESVYRFVLVNADLISRQQAIGEAERWLYDGDDNRTIGEMLRDLPSIQPERMKGEWIHQAKFGRVECDQCGKVFRNAFVPKNFCPNCGSDMRGEENGQE